jgi:hypothetical protein
VLTERWIGLLEQCGPRRFNPRAPLVWNGSGDWGLCAGDSLGELAQVLAAKGPAEVEVPAGDDSSDRRRAPLNRKCPAGEAGRFLGLLQGVEMDISIYVDRWEVGGP